MGAIYEEAFETFFKVTPEFEEFIGLNKGHIYSDAYFEKGSARIYISKEDSFLWGDFSEEGDLSIHWHIAANILPKKIEGTLFKGNSLIRNGKVVYSNLAAYGHSFVPVNEGLVVNKRHQEAERVHVKELEKIILENKDYFN